MQHHAKLQSTRNPIGSRWRIAGPLVAAAWLGMLMQSGTQADPKRSAWMWTQSSDSFGAANVLGDPAKEALVRDRFDSWNFDRIYTSVGNLPLSDPEVLANWNATLSAQGVSSQMLLGANTWIYPANRTDLLARVQTRLLNFNASRTNPAERLTGLHLDIEPQGLTEWSSSSAAEKKALLYHLRDTYADVRSHMDQFGGADVPIYADLPVWFDSSSSIGWDDAAERDAWFADISDSLAGISLMAFERGSLSSIVSGVQWEIDNLPIEVRVGLNVKEIGPGDTFDDLAELESLALQIEQHYGDEIGGIDYQPFYTYMDVAPEPVKNADFDASGRVDGGDFLIWQRGYGIAASATLGDGDANANGAVNGYDLEAWRATLGASSIGLTAVPEPSAMLLQVGLPLIALAGRAWHAQRAR